MSDTWSPSQYEKFKDQRSQPFWDLLALVQGQEQRYVVDLGCGTGELTQGLHQKLKAKSTIGIDSSAKMLEKAESFKTPGLSFTKADIGTFVPSAKCDLVFSNAALQWLPNHRDLFIRLASFVAPNGEIAVQMPANHDHPSHRIAREIAGKDARETSVLPVEEYAELFHDLGFVQSHARVQVYGHPMEASEQVIEWVRGTTLTEYEKKFSPPDFEKFLAEYRKRLLGEIGVGPYFYAFKRILLWAKRA